MRQQVEHDVSKNGRFLAVLPMDRDSTNPQPHIVCVQNWFAELARLTAAQ